jgi:hypothetical protein
VPNLRAELSIAARTVVAWTLSSRGRRSGGSGGLISGAQCQDGRADANEESTTKQREDSWPKVTIKKIPTFAHQNKMQQPSVLVNFTTQKVIFNTFLRRKV